MHVLSFKREFLLSDRCEPSMLTEVSRNTHRNIPHATFAVVHDRIVISNAPDSCPLKNPLAPCILPGPMETGGQQGQWPKNFCLWLKKWLHQKNKGALYY